MKNNKGFTLIELLVVIAIIGLLSTLAVVSLNNARQKSRDAKRVSDIKTIQTALELRYVDAEGYPAGATARNIGGDTGSYNAIDSSATGLVGTCGASPTTCYMGNVPEDPSVAATGTACILTSAATCAYSYVSDATGTEYSILFYLEGDTGDLGQGINCATETGIASSCLH